MVGVNLGMLSACESPFGGEFSIFECFPRDLVIFH